MNTFLAHYLGIGVVVFIVFAFLAAVYGVGRFWAHAVGAVWADLNGDDRLGFYTDAWGILVLIGVIAFILILGGRAVAVGFGWL